MQNFDFYQIDGQLLRTFLLVLEETSVTAAAERMGVNQSTVTYSLNKLRRIVSDPLFIRSGQGLVPTETARSLREPARQALDKLQYLTNMRPFDPAREAMKFNVAANDMQRDILFPRLISKAWNNGIDLALELRPSGVPSVALLRDAKCDLLITPLPPDAPDLIQQKLFAADLMVFFDPDHGRPPETVDEYLAAEHITVNFALGGSSEEVIRSRELPYVPPARISVSNFAGIPPFVLGTHLITTQSANMKSASLKDLAMAPLPFAAEAVQIFMVWHQRSTNDPAHKWLRAQVREVAKEKGL